MIVTFTLPAMAHVKPVMPLLSGLMQRNHKVVCFGHKAFEDIIRSSGAAFEPYPEIAYDVNAPDFNLVRMGADIIDAAYVIREALLPRVRALAPRMVIQDFMAAWASLIGTELGIPRIHTVPTIVFTPETERMMRREDGALKLAGDVWRGAPHLLRAHIRSGFALSIREAFGLQRSWRRIAPPVAELVFSIEALQPGEPEGDVPRHYIGHPFDPGRTFAPVDLDGYALITFGTLSNNDTGRFEAAMRGVVAAGLSAVIICGGRKVDVAHLESLGRRLEAENLGRKIRVIERTPELERWIIGADLMVSHAGMATTWETIRFGKPSLLIPTIADQMAFANALERYGLGVRLPRGREFDPDAIADGVRAALALRFPRERLAADVAAAGGTERGLDVILAALGQSR